MALNDGKIQVGNELNSTGTFRNAKDNLTPIDPTEVYVTYLKPDGSTLQYEFGDPDNVITRTGTGVYTADVIIDMEGRWRVRWWSTGNAVASTEQCVRAVAVKAVESS